MSQNHLPSSPANPATLQREIGPLFFRLTAEGLTLFRPGHEPLRLDPEEALALADFWRTPGARSLVNRAWLAHQHAVERAESTK